jgi:hypothetical protein
MQVYLRIKAAMELAEEARLERDAATSTTTALQQQLEATQVNAVTECICNTNNVGCAHFCQYRMVRGVHGADS